jgi:hypothetical protein
MRLLTIEEMDLVAGGDGEDGGDIVVTGKRPKEVDSPFGNDPGFYNGGGGGGGTGGGFGGGVAPQWQAGILAELGKWVFTDVLNKITGTSDAQANEQKVAQDFHPQGSTQTDFQGHKAWMTPDGTLFVDGNNNNAPDAEFYVDSSNNLWGNGGAGWINLGHK